MYHYDSRFNTVMCFTRQAPPPPHTQFTLRYYYSCEHEHVCVLGERRCPSVYFGNTTNRYTPRVTINHELKVDGPDAMYPQPHTNTPTRGRVSYCSPHSAKLLCRKPTTRSRAPTLHQVYCLIFLCSACVKTYHFAKLMYPH